MWISDSDVTNQRISPQNYETTNFVGSWFRRDFRRFVTKREARGFTLIELLIVIAIVGILTTVGTVSLVQARRRTRDTKRVSDIQQMRNALVIFSNQRATYPTVPDPEKGLILGEGDQKCLDDEGLKAVCDPGQLIIMQSVPREIVVTHPKYVYFFESPTSYKIEFTLEGELGDLPGGACTARPEGITCP